MAQVTDNRERGQVWRDVYLVALAGAFGLLKSGRNLPFSDYVAEQTPQSYAEQVADRAIKRWEDIYLPPEKRSPFDEREDDVPF